MRIFWALLRRELQSFFFSMTGYAIIAAVALLIGVGFLVLINSLGSEPFTEPVTAMFFNTLFFWMIVLLIAPVITMRLFALEKATGTFETLMTTSAGDLQVVLAKFIAAAIFYLIAWLPLLVCLFIVQHFARQTGTLNAGNVGGMYLGIFLIGGVFVSLGCLASAISNSQMVAALVSFVFGTILIALAYAAKSTQGALVIGRWQTRVLSQLDLFDQMHDFARGLVDTRAIVLYATATLVFLFLTLRVVESRRWK